MLDPDMLSCGMLCCAEGECVTQCVLRDARNVPWLRA